MCQTSVSPANAALNLFSQDASNVVLAQGVPPMELFPLADLNVKLADGTEVALSKEDVQMAQR
jgi:hypothetical protein